MRRLVPVFAALGLLHLGCAGPAARAPALHRPPLPMPADLAPGVARAEKVGRVIYLLDKAAATGTDVLVERLGSLDEKGLGGYLPVLSTQSTRAPPLAVAVLFYSRDAEPRLLYRVDVLEGAAPRFEAFSPPSPLPAETLASIRARRAAIDAAGPFQQPINPLLLRAEPFGGVGTLVYLLAGTKRPNLAVLGKHFRVPVDEHGQVGEVFALSKGVIEIDLAPQGSKILAAMVVSHLVTDAPVETHVFASLLYKKTLMVVTRRGMFQVEDGQITLIDEGMKLQAGSP